MVDVVRGALPMRAFGGSHPRQGRRPFGRIGVVGGSFADAAHIPENAGQNSDFKSLTRTEWGDRISIRDLLKMTNPLGAEAVLSELGEDGLPRRERGGVLALSIEYSNFAYYDFW